MGGSRREGFALAAAVMALVVVGALVTGGFYAASREGRISSSTRYAGEVFNVAEHGLHEVVGTWKLARYEAIPVGGSALFLDTLRAGISATAPAIGEVRVQVRRLSTSTYFLSSTGRLIEHGRATDSKRSLGMLVRTSRLDINADRAVQLMGDLMVAGHSAVNGNDYIPDAWKESGDCRDLGPRAGVVAKNASGIETGDSGKIVGSPPELQDASIDTSSFTHFGEWSYDELAAMADPAHVFPPGTEIGNTAADTLSDGACDTALATNWGDPDHADRACSFYFPIIHAQGDLTLDAKSSGQGILLVDGDLRITGGFAFNGIVIVRGRVTTGSGNSRINGITTIMNRGGGRSGRGVSSFAGSAVVRFSSCAIERAVRYNSGTARAFPIAERSWMDLTAAGMGA